MSEAQPIHEAVPHEAFEATPVDRARLEALAEELGPPAPSEAQLIDWMADVQLAVLSSLGDVMGDALPWDVLLKGGFWVLLGATLLALTGTAGWVLWRWWRRRSTQELGVFIEDVPPAAMPVDPWEQLARLRAAGDATGALTALWIALAQTLSRLGLGELRPDASHREFVASVVAQRPDWGGLPDLRRLARRVERLHFAGDPVTLDDIDALMPAARQVASS